MKNSIKMIVTDLDGTLLRTDKTISERTKTALRRCREAGIKVAYATGRSGRSLKQIAPAESFDGRITSNGAIAKVGDEIVYNRVIPCLTIRPILLALCKYGMKISLNADDGMVYSNFDVSSHWANITNFKIVDFSKHDMDTEKLFTLNPTREDKKIIEQLLPADLYFLETIDVNGFVGLVMHKDATKAKAVAELARLWDIGWSEIAAFGDDINDIDMLSSAGMGVAMGNAVDEAKSVSDFTCLDNNNDGVAKWIEENIL